MTAMSRYSSEERRRIIDETNAALARGEADDQRRGEAEYLQDMRPSEDVLAEAMSAPVEDRVANWRREAEEQEQRFARQRRAERRRSAEHVPSRSAEIDLRISSAIADERRFMIEVIGEAVAELMARQREAVDAELLPLRTELAKLKAEFAEAKVRACELEIINANLREQMAGDRSKVIDLPNPLRRVN